LSKVALMLSYLLFVGCGRFTTFICLSDEQGKLAPIQLLVLQTQEIEKKVEGESGCSWKRRYVTMALAV
jgi:hypothetical protein